MNDFIIFFTTPNGFFEIRPKLVRRKFVEII